MTNPVVEKQLFILKEIETKINFIIKHPRRNSIINQMLLTSVIKNKRITEDRIASLSTIKNCRNLNPNNMRHFLMDNAQYIDNLTEEIDGISKLLN